MPPKPKGKGKKAKNDVKETTDDMTNLDRAFYETTVADLTQKLATCREQNIKMQQKMEEMDSQFKQFEEDRTDVTGYLDRSVLIKQANITDLEDKLSELGKVRDSETKEFQRIIKEWEIKFKAMQEELTSETKLLTGKLVSLEEFRIQRDELMAKFDQQESNLKEQSQRHNEILQEMERKQIVDKNTLKCEVENKLLELSSEFSRASEVRISAHVQRLVRENIALNNELDRIMFTHRRLQNEIKTVKDRDKERNESTATYRTENKQLVKACDTQIEIIKRLTSECEKLKMSNQVLMASASMKEHAERRETQAVKELNDYRAKTHLLEQHVHAIRTECEKHKSIVQEYVDESKRLSNILTKLNYTVKSACRGEDDPRDDPKFREAQRKNLLSELSAILMTVDDIIPKTSLDTISSINEVYSRGDLGMTPSHSISSILRMRRPFARRIMSGSELDVKESEKEELKDDQSLNAEKSYESFPIIDLESGSVVAYSNSAEGSLSKGGDEEGDEEGFESSDEENGDDKPKPPKKQEKKASLEKVEKVEVLEKVEKMKSSSQKSQEKIDDPKLLEKKKSSSEKSEDHDDEH